MTETKSKEELMEVAQNMEFRELPEEYSVTGLKYRQITKSDKAAVYGHNNTSTSYEVFKLKTSKAGVVMGNPVPDRERVPGNEDFGTWAWCVSEKERAMEIFEEINQGLRDYDLNTN